MKKVYLLLFSLLMISMSLFSETITIGTGTSTTRYPLNDYYVYSRSQALYLASEIGISGSITNIRWYRNDTGADPNAIGTTEIWLMETANSVLTGTDWEGPGTLVATINNIDLGAGNGWINIPITSFAYNGTNNLLVSVRTQNAPYTSPHAYYRYTSTSTNYRMRQGNSDGTNPPTMSLSYYRPNIQFEILSTNPSLSVSPSTLAFGYSPSGTPSASQSYVLSGVNLTAGPVVVTAPDGFQVSLDNTAWSSSVNVTYTAPTLGNTTIYARFNGSAPGTPYAGNISHVGGGATKNVAVTGTTDLFSAYCTSAATYTGDEDILNVTVGALNNTSTCATVAPGVGSVQNKYSNYFFDVPPVDLQKLGTVNFSVNVGTCGSNYNSAVKIFIDYNQDGDFTDAGETVYTPSTYSYGPHVESGTFVVPADAVTGYTMMRVVNVETTTIANIVPCGTYGYGETEDYKVNITPPPPFVVTPEIYSYKDTYVGLPSEPALFTLQNNLPQSVNVTGINFTGPNASDFQLSGSYAFPIAIAPGSSVDVNVVFNPLSQGDKEATMVINETNGSHDVLLSGTGYLNAPYGLYGAPVFPNDIQLEWFAPLPSYEIRDDDNSAESYYWFANPTDNHRYAKKLVIPTDGTLNHVALLTYATSASQWESVLICPELTPNVPNLAAPLYTFNNVAVTTDLSWIILSPTGGINVTAGQNLYVVAKWVAASANGPFLGRDMGSVSGRSFYTTDGGTSWFVSGGNHMIRGYMTPASKGTDNAFAGLKSEVVQIHDMSSLIIDESANEGVSKNREAKENSMSDKHASVGMIKHVASKAPAIYTEPTGKNGVLFTVKRGTETGVYDTEFSNVTGTSFLDQTAAPGTAYYYAVEVDYGAETAMSEEIGVATPYSIPFVEDVAPGNPLVGWNQTSSFGTSIWSVEDSNEAGELPNEFMATYVDEIGITRLIAPPINTSGDASVFLFFRHFYNAFGFGIDYKIQTSADGINWTDESWSGVGSTTNVGPEAVYVQLQHNLGALTYVAWVLDGDHYQFDYWHVDDIQLTFDLSVTAVPQNLSCFNSNDGEIELVLNGGVTPYTILWQGPDGFTSDQPTISGLAAGTYTYTVTDANFVTSTNVVTLTQPDAVPVPTISNVTVTYDGMVHSLEALAPAGTDIVWYDAATGGNLTTAPTESTAGVYPVWVAAVDPDLGCESARVAAVLTINKKGLTVTANNQVRCQFNANPELTLTYSGFVAGQGPESLETAPAASTTANQASLPGVYPITVGGGVSANYTFTYVPGTLTVTQSPSVDAGPDAAICDSETFTVTGAIASNYTTLLWSTAGDGSFSNANALLPVYTPGAADIANGSVVLTLTADPSSLCFQQSTMTLTIQGDLMVSVDIVQVTTEVCVGTETHFMAIPTNGGLNPAYQWKVNGTNAGTNSADFAYVPANGDVVTVVLTSSFGCAVNNPATSDPFTVTVTGDLIAGVSIYADATTVCDYTTVTYTAIPENGGTNPSYQWYVNGLAAGTNAPVFAYQPLNGDEIFVEMTSNHSCAVVTEATSNIVSMQVAPPYLELFANPVKGGTVTGTGNYPAGSQVTVVATPKGGWEFLDWRNADGLVLSTEATYVHTINYCYEALYATFSSTAKIAGQVKYFNAGETIIQSPNENSVFYVQLFEGSTAIGDRQLVRYSPDYGLESYYEYIGVESGKNYTLRVWEQATNNQLGNTWTWNNWGGTTATDALIIGYMTTGNPVLTQLPWIAPVAVPNYTPLFTEVADVNNSNSLTAVDPLLLQLAMTGDPQYMPLPGGAHNFQFATTNLPNHAAAIYPQAPEVVFTPFGTYNAATTASDVYYEAILPQLNEGLNVINIYLVATGDLNASYNPASGSKSGSSLNYAGMIAAAEGEEVLIPVTVDQNVTFGAMTIGFSYDTQKLQLLGVEGYPVYYINEEEGTVRISWFDQAGKTLSAGDNLLFVKARITGALHDGDRYFELLDGAEFADLSAQVINGLGLSSPYIETGVTGIGDLQAMTLAHSAYPNPFNDVTNINYVLPETGKVKVVVYNTFGQEVLTLVDAVQAAGAQHIRLQNTQLRDAGQYFYRITLDGSLKTWHARGSMVLVK